MVIAFPFNCLRIFVNLFSFSLVTCEADTRASPEAVLEVNAQSGNRNHQCGRKLLLDYTWEAPTESSLTYSRFHIYEVHPPIVSFPVGTRHFRVPTIHKPGIDCISAYTAPPFLIPNSG